MRLAALAWHTRSLSNGRKNRGESKILPSFIEKTSPNGTGQNGYVLLSNIYDTRTVMSTVLLQMARVPFCYRRGKIKSLSKKGRDFIVDLFILNKINVRLVMSMNITTIPSEVGINLTHITYYNTVHCNSVLLNIFIF